jgi:hypothetical protein
MQENPTQPAMMTAVSLWVGTAVLGLGVIAAIIQDILPRLFASLALSPDLYQVAYNALALLLALLWIVVVVGGGEYHRTRIGRPRSWQLFGWTLGVELAILLVAIML